MTFFATVWPYRHLADEKQLRQRPFYVEIRTISRVGISNPGGRAELYTALWLLTTYLHDVLPNRHMVCEKQCDRQSTFMTFDHKGMTSQ